MFEPPPEGPITNFETICGVLIGYTFLAVGIWYLIFHPGILGAVARDFKAWIPKVKENCRQDLAKSKELVRRWLK